MPRYIDSNTLEALKGSRTGDSLIVWPWYNGMPATDSPLEISSWSATWQDTREYQELQIEVVDEDSTLGPWMYSDPLGCGGAVLQAVYQVGGAGTINLGWYRVSQSQPKQQWQAYRIDEYGTVTPDAPMIPGTLLTMQSAGGGLSITGWDYAAPISRDKFIAPESPVGASPTVIGEIKRLLQNWVPVSVLSGVTDTSVNSTLIYKQQDDRWASVQDLAKRISAGVRMNGDGVCEVYPLAFTSSSFNLYGGSGNVLMAVDRQQQYEGLYNFFVADGTATINGQQQAVRGTASITGGELAFGGPHGRYPTFYSSTMLVTQDQADAYAAQMRDTQIAGMTLDLFVTCAPLPHLMLGDWVTVAQPVVNGMAVPLNGRVVTMNMRSSKTATDAMTLTVRCNYADVVAALSGAGQISIAGPVNRNVPGVTMPDTNTFLDLPNTVTAAAPAPTLTGGTGTSVAAPTATAFANVPTPSVVGGGGTLVPKWYVQRTNLCTNPRFALNTSTGWSCKTTTGFTFAPSTGSVWSTTGSSYSLLYENETAGSAQMWAGYGVDFSGTNPASNSYSVAVTPGNLVTVGIPWKLSTANNLNAMTMKVWWFNSSGALLSTATVNSSSNPSSSWAFNYGTVTAPFGAASFGVGVSATISANSSGVYIGGATIEIGTAGPFFCGGLTTNSDFSYAWSGSADASTSTETQLRRVNYAANPSFETNTTSWSATNVTASSSTDVAVGRTHSLKMVSAGSGGSLCTGTVANTFRVGTVFSLGFWAYSTVGQTVSPQVSGSGNQIGPTNISIPANTWTFLKFEGLQFGAGLQTTSVSIAIGTSYPSAGTLYIDDVQLEAAPDLGGNQYFDGSTTIPGWTTAWLGTADGSYSTATPVDATPLYPSDTLYPSS